MKWNQLVVFVWLVALSECRPQWLNGDLSWRILGGRNAEEGEFLYQVSLRQAGSHVCGGSIVDKEWVITAAHCVRLGVAEDFIIQVGSTKLNLGGVRYQVRTIASNRDYNPSSGQNDVAILKVDPIEFNDLVQPIPLEKAEIGTDVPVTLSGWGSISLGGFIPNDLQAINLTTISIAQCRASHVNTRPVTERQVCTFTKYGEGACHGDSGGPLVTGTKESGRRLLGIVSWGEPCAVGKPDVFANAGSYVDWFNSQCNCNL